MRILSEVVEPPITKGCGDKLNGDLNTFYILKLSIGIACYQGRRNTLNSNPPYIYPHT